MKIANKMILPVILFLGVYTHTYAAGVEKTSTDDDTHAALLTSNQEVVIQDEVLRKVILQSLNKAPTDNLTKNDLLSLTTLTISAEQGKAITSLKGLEQATNLAIFIMDDSSVTDFSPLESLTNLERVDLVGSNITSENFPDLSSNPKLTFLSSMGAQLDNDIFLKITQLTNLERIVLDSNKNITTLKPLKILPNLRSISVQFCGISDFTVIKEFPALKDLAGYGQMVGFNAPVTTLELNALVYDEAQQELFIPFSVMPDRLTNFDGYLPPFSTSASASNTILKLDGTTVSENRLQISEQGIFVAAVSKEAYENLKTLSYNARLNSPAGSYPIPTGYSFYSISNGTYYHQFNIIDTPVDGLPVTVKYVDENGQEIAAAQTLTGIINSAYKAVPQNLPGWVLKQLPANADGYFTDTAQEVIFVYEKAQGAPVTVRYLDEDGRDLTEPFTLSGKLDDTFTVEPKEFASWQLKTAPANSQGHFTDAPQTVTFIYEKAQGAPVTVRYLDEDGRDLTEPLTLSGKLDDTFTVEPKEFASWQLKTAPANSQGHFTDAPQTVTFIYEKAQGAPVTVHYLDEFGKNLAEPLILKGKIGEPYKVEVKSLNLWSLKNMPENVQGVFTDQPQHINFTYEQKIIANDLPLTPKHVLAIAKETNEQTHTTTHSDVLPRTAQADNGLLPLPYTNLERQLIPETAPAHKQTKITNRAKTADIGSLTVKFVDEKGREIAAPATFKGKVGEHYKISVKNQQAKVQRQK
ncbi:hypothetical protein GIX45_25380 [Erwinia sp. CPCC 100877]|nr:hypothetical protein [Erwinia sp. CPCC 100877]